MAHCPKYQPEAVKGARQVLCAVDEEFGVVDVVLGFQLAEELDGELGRLGWKQPDVEEVFSRRNDRRDEPVLFVGDSDRFLVKGDLTSGRVTERCASVSLPPS